MNPSSQRFGTLAQARARSGRVAVNLSPPAVGRHSERRGRAGVGPRPFQDRRGKGRGRTRWTSFILLGRGWAEPGGAPATCAGGGDGEAAARPAGDRADHGPAGKSGKTKNPDTRRAAGRRFRSAGPGSSSHQSSAHAPRLHPARHTGRPGCRCRSGHSQCSEHQGRRRRPVRGTGGAAARASRRQPEDRGVSQPQIADRSPGPGRASSAATPTARSPRPGQRAGRFAYATGSRHAARCAFGTGLGQSSAPVLGVPWWFGPPGHGGKARRSGGTARSGSRFQPGRKNETGRPWRLQPGQGFGEGFPAAQGAGRLEQKDTGAVRAGGR